MKTVRILVGLRNRCVGGMIFVLCVGTAIAASAQTFTTLLKFDYTNGAGPEGSLIQGIDGNFYGTASYGGTNNDGTVFRMTPAGALTTLYSFCAQTGCTDGNGPGAGLTQATDGDFYGTTDGGGTENWGAVFEMTPTGRLTTLYSFTGEADGKFPSGLVRGINNDLYGTTSGPGGNSCAGANCGTVFKITPGGVLTTVSTFDFTDGASPLAGVIQGTDGSFYGTTGGGGLSDCSNANGCGTVFKMSPAGVLTTLYRFCSQTGCTDGVTPLAGLVQGTDGNFYGTTGGGGTYNLGTVFRMTPAGALTTLYSFCSQTGCTDGAAPYAGLIQATDGDFYGTTNSGGTSDGYGTVFKITPQGSLTTLHRFNAAEGEYPFSNLLEATSGALYGTTFEGGALSSCSGLGCGTIFSVSVGLGPFVKALPAAGKVGTEVGIFGNQLTGASAVTFNSTPAQFTVHSATLILTHVPTGATTGKVRITLPDGALTSAVPFYVLP